MSESTDHAQIVMAVSIIAIVRKVIILDVKDLSGLAQVGLPLSFWLSPLVTI